MPRGCSSLDRAGGRLGRSAVRRSARAAPAPGDCLVVNESRVIPARLLGALAADGRRVELLLLRALAPERWEALVAPGAALPGGARVALGGGAARARSWRERTRMACAWSSSRRRGRCASCSSATGCRRCRPTSSATPRRSPRTASATRPCTRATRARWRRRRRACTSRPSCSRGSRARGVEVHALTPARGAGHLPARRRPPSRPHAWRRRRVRFPPAPPRP